jgi:putative DNA methylase
MGVRRYGHTPTVGDAFAGGGSIPFEAARVGCDVYASDINPVAGLLTWAALNIVGGGEKIVAEVRQAQEKVYNAVRQQVEEWGIERNEHGWIAEAYLYCNEVRDPRTGWTVPVAPSWVIATKKGVAA